MKGDIYFYFHGAVDEHEQRDYNINTIKLQFHDGVLQNVLRKLMKTEVRIELNQCTVGEKDEIILIPFRLFIEMLVRRGLVPYVSGDNDAHGY